MTIERTQVKDSYIMCYEVTFSQETIAEDCAFLKEASEYETIEEYQVKAGIATAKVYTGDDVIINHLTKFC